VAILVVLALMLSRVLTPHEALAGFGDPVVVLIAAIFIVGEALVNTGVVHRLGEAVMKLGGGNETRLIVLIMTLAGGLGAFMSSSAIVAMFIPLVLTVARKTGLNSKRMLMPLSVAALVSGMMTLIASSPNMIIESTLRGRGLAPLDFFSWTPFGLGVGRGDRVHVGGAGFAEQANHCEGRCGYLSERLRSRRLLWSHRSLASITCACRLAAHRSVRGADETIIRRLKCRSRGL
jgi:di/tricarboxylate transporter